MCNLQLMFNAGASNGFAGASNGFTKNQLLDVYLSICSKALVKSYVCVYSTNDILVVFANPDHSFITNSSAILLALYAGAWNDLSMSLLILGVKVKCSFLLLCEWMLLTTKCVNIAHSKTLPFMFLSIPLKCICIKGLSKCSYQTFY